MCRKINKLQLHISFDFFWFLIKKRHFWWENKRRTAYCRVFKNVCIYIYTHTHTYTNPYIYIYIYIYIYVYKYRESAGRFSRETVLNKLKQSGINIPINIGKRDATTFSRQACFVNRFTLQGFNERIFMWLSSIY